MDHESDIPKDHEITSVPWVSGLNFLISDNMTSEIISLEIKQREINQFANKWARGKWKSLIQNQNTKLG